MPIVYLGVGSNMGDRLANLQRAVDELRGGDVTIKQISPVYETAPQDITSQPDFLNAAIEAETSLQPLRLLQRVQRIEREIGRRRVVNKGPRVIDIDILLYGSVVVSTTGLTIPHPALMARRFALQPLVDLQPELRHPMTHQLLRSYLSTVADQEIAVTPLRLTY